MITIESVGMKAQSDANDFQDNPVHDLTGQLSDRTCLVLKNGNVLFHTRYELNRCG